MKKIFIILLLITSFSVNAQRDTLTKESNGDIYEFYKKTMIINVEKDGLSSDTVIEAHLIFNQNKLAWGDNKKFNDVCVEQIRDSIIEIFAGSFEGLLVSLGLQSFENDYGIHNLSKVMVNYNDSLVSTMSITYKKQEKSRNGTLTERHTDSTLVLNQEQIDAFSVLLLSPQISGLETDLYNRRIN